MKEIKGFKYVLVNFIKSESFGGVFLFICALLAMVMANSPLSEQYFKLWNVDFGIKLSQSQIFGLKIGNDGFIGLSLYHWINDVLMSLFFLMVGLEIKREILFGELSSLKQASFPILAAIGGMIVPGIIYIALNLNTPSVDGFGIPMATDIAFALGVVMLLGKRIPMALKVFLVTLAVADDLGAIIIIATFYTTEISFYYLLVSLGFILVLIILNKLGVKNISVYLLVGFGLWFCIHHSGIHATIAAVILAFCIPSGSNGNKQEFSRSLSELADTFKVDPSIKMVASEQIKLLDSIKTYIHNKRSPLAVLEERLHPLSAYFIMPLFAFANAGVNIQGEINLNIDYIFWGIILGLVVGKPLGIVLITFICEKFKITTRPNGITWPQIIGAGMLAGIGFTMSIFVSNLAFDGQNAVIVSKIAILAASLISGIIGTIYLIFATRK
ncbi:Na+/H+ antiporter NhaA [Mergibacter septicus]|uniref:Na(+)/H(+) antiporter NhaA n=1 Tax=Mergibacter septicus TaxID=221402 RepID=A0A8D4IXV6_9PAST|nr:Na+/H+ antiporter NhaA [Mergibacter septicus]AWX15833.1 Na+/H+ antiporter NhaA [Mergibacter septicus]QDJ15086.1 Na+/H+ antiporter NhaA [Mergibacter septicus]UTU47490.1 Na+/H+ antiporter NhaA [Mergibacter septicus]WMR95329.1 Na+/H+ antiporter NhaA [Mergibacter septicus]